MYKTLWRAPLESEVVSSVEATLIKSCRRLSRSVVYRPSVLLVGNVTVDVVDKTNALVGLYGTLDSYQCTELHDCLTLRMLTGMHSTDEPCPRRHVNFATGRCGRIRSSSAERFRHPSLRRDR